MLGVIVSTYLKDSRLWERKRERIAWLILLKITTDNKIKYQRYFKIIGIFMQKLEMDMYWKLLKIQD